MFSSIEVEPIDAVRTERLLKKYEIQISGLVTIENVHAQTVNFNGTKRTSMKISLPADVVGGSPVHRRYISHLLTRYKQFAGKRSDRTFRPAAVYGAIQGEFGTTWDWIGVNRFEEFSAFLQKKIDKTIIGKLNRSKGIPNYSSFQQYCEKHKNR